ncbi:IS701 family transposase [Streptomyces sp. CA-111067]|uniref:IS701 family transposase n=1 Tax=Streptomyces sp. CA-111067 TaxID=3240046 RepID=UPI003D9626C3
MTAYDGGPARSADVGLTAFAEAVFDQLPRADQRRWAHLYLQGLLTTDGKKSVRRIAASVSSSATACQSLQQFVNTSPWDWRPVRLELARWICEYAPPAAWTIGSAALPKRGGHSVGVHRRFVPALGRVITCQLGVGLFLSTEHGAFPVDWRLLLPGPWAQDTQLRSRTRVPDDAPVLPTWALVRDLVDSAAAHRVILPAPVVADISGASTEAQPLLRAFAKHDLVVAVPGTLRVLPDSRPPAGGARGDKRLPAVSAQEVLSQHRGQPHTVVVHSRNGRSRPLHIVSALVRLPEPRHQYGPAAEPTYRLFAERVSADRPPGRIWLTNLVHRRLDELLVLAGHHAGTATTERALERDFGLIDYEGRSFPGWHHHMTLVSAAFAFGRLAGAAAPAGAPGPAEDLRQLA